MTEEEDMVIWKYYYLNGRPIKALIEADSAFCEQAWVPDRKSGQLVDDVAMAGVVSDQGTPDEEITEEQFNKLVKEYLANPPDYIPLTG